MWPSYERFPDDHFLSLRIGKTMSHRTILTPRQRSALFDLPGDRASLIAHYVLSDRDLGIVRRRKGAANQLGFALQLCAFRWKRVA